MLLLFSIDMSMLLLIGTGPDLGGPGGPDPRPPTKMGLSAVTKKTFQNKCVNI